MHGLLIVNGFVREESFLALRDALCAAAEAHAISLDVRANDALLFDASSGTPLFDAPEYDFAILWDKDKYLGLQLEARGMRVFNNVRALALCDDKALTHIALARHNIPMPRTVLVPRTYRFVGYGGMEFPGLPAYCKGMQRFIWQAGIPCQYPGRGRFAFMRARGDAHVNAGIRAHEPGAGHPRVCCWEPCGCCNGAS